MTKSKVNICDFTFEQLPDLLMICHSTMIPLRAKRADPKITFPNYIFFFFFFLQKKTPKQTQKSNLFYLETAIGSFIRKCRNNLFDLEDSRDFHYKRPLQCL